MEDRYMNLIFEVQEDFFSDEDHQELNRAFERALRCLREVINGLPDKQQEALGDFLHIAEKVHYQLMVHICEQLEKAEKL